VAFRETAGKNKLASNHHGREQFDYATSVHTHLLCGNYRWQTIEPLNDGGPDDDIGELTRKHSSRRRHFGKIQRI